MDFRANDVYMGRNNSELQLTKSGKIKVTAKVAARLDKKSDPSLMNRPLDHQPYWHIERARISEDSGKVKMELIRNGYPVAHQNIEADGSLNDLTFEVEATQSSWYALRIFPSSHTNPIFVTVGKKPIRASSRSAEWCLKSVDQCWSQKKSLIAKNEMKDALAAYEHARKAYRRILAESKTK